MATAQRFGIYPCSFVHAGGTLDLAQMDSFDAQANARRNALIPGGAVDRAHVGTASASPKIMFATRDLTTLFGTVSTSAGLALSGAGTFRLQERSTLSTFESGATHETFTVTGGILVPTQLSASQDGEDGASCSLELTPVWDGTNNPIVHNTGVNFSGAPTPAFTSRFFLGPVYHNGTQIGGVTNVSIDFGITVDARAFNGSPYAVYAPIIRREPVFNITIAKIDDLSSVGLFGNAITNSFAVYFQKGVASGTRVAAATTSHCKISCTAGDYNHEAVTVSQNDDGSATISVMPTSTVAVSVASAIP